MADIRCISMTSRMGFVNFAKHINRENNCIYWNHHGSLISKNAYNELWSFIFSINISLSICQLSFSKNFTFNLINYFFVNIFLLNQSIIFLYKFHFQIWLLFFPKNFSFKNFKLFQFRYRKGINNHIFLWWTWILLHH